MTKQQIVSLYGQSVYQIRLHVAMQLVAAKSMKPEDALSEADKFVYRLMEEDAAQLLSRYDTTTA